MAETRIPGSRWSERLPLILPNHRKGLYSRAMSLWVANIQGELKMNWKLCGQILQQHCRNMIFSFSFAISILALDNYSKEFGIWIPVIIKMIHFILCNIHESAQSTLCNHGYHYYHVPSAGDGSGFENSLSDFMMVFECR